MFTKLIKRESDECRICGQKSEDYFGCASVQVKRQIREVWLFSLCRKCYQVDAACAEAEADGVRFTSIGTGIDGVAVCYNGDRCPCGAVTHALLGRCIQCFKDERMLTKAQAEKKFIDKLLKNLRAEIKLKTKELEHEH